MRAHLKPDTLFVRALTLGTFLVAAMFIATQLLVWVLPHAKISKTSDFAQVGFVALVPSLVLAFGGVAIVRYRRRDQKRPDVVVPAASFGWDRSLFGTIMSKVFAQGGSLVPVQAAADWPNPTSLEKVEEVDLATILDGMASRERQKLDWRHSIVDLMKLLNIDASLAARRQLADELNYSGSADDAAAMNDWLHREVMHKIAENGGRLPDDVTL